MFSGVGAAAAAVQQPVVSIIIDDLGRTLPEGLRAVRLPGPVACAFLPRSPYTRQLAIIAHARHKVVMLHLPMQALDYRRLDPGGLTLHMTHQDFVQTVRTDLADVPYATGINNHMGSLLTQHPGDMLWLMRLIHRHGGLFFVDSRTTAATVAEQMAMESHVPTTERNVFLDDNRSEASIRRQFERLIAFAETHGSAVAIGHPHPHTLAVLERMIPELRRRGVRLISIAAMIRFREQRRATWQASLSHSPAAARNSKPSP